METRADGMLIYDDQLMEMAEGILRAEGLKDLTEVQIRIIELVFFEGMCPADVRRIMEMSLKEIRIEVRSIRKTLSKVM